jgi:DNA-binding transcriptional regulator YiaG
MINASNMTAKEFREALETLGLGNVEASRLFGVDDRTCRRWASGADIPIANAALLRIMIAYKIEPADMYKMATGRKFKG